MCLSKIRSGALQHSICRQLAAEGLRGRRVLSVRVGLAQPSRMNLNCGESPERRI